MDDVANGVYDMTKSIFVGPTPPAMVLVGADPLEVTMQPSIVHKVTQGAHDLNLDTLKQVSVALKDPVFIFESASRPNAKEQLRHHRL